MEFLAPFWNQLFRRCDAKTQSALVRVCTRIYTIGMTDENLHRRFLLCAPKSRRSSHHYRLKGVDACVKLVGQYPHLASFMPFEIQTPEFCKAR